LGKEVPVSFSPQELDSLWVHRPLLAIFASSPLVMSSLIHLEVALCPEIFNDLSAVYLALKIASLRIYIYIFFFSIRKIVSLL
jgi:hypothetical protein